MISVDHLNSFANLIVDAIIDLELTHTKALPRRQQIFVGFEQNGPDALILHKRCEKWFDDNVRFNPAVKMDFSPTRETQALACLSVDEIYQLLSLIKAALSSEECDTSLTEILEFSDGALSKLFNVYVKRNDQPAGQLGNSSSSIQFCQPLFILLGRLTKLYEPASPSLANNLEVVLPASPIIASRFQKVESVMNSSVAIDEASSKRFHQLLGLFGLRIPSIMTQRAINGTSGGLSPRSTTLAASNLFYSNLHRVGKLKIEWVADMINHLALDERNRTLRLFCFPSYCALICLSDPDSTRPLNMYVWPVTMKIDQI